MDTSFDIIRLLKNHAKKHKIRPSQFVSVEAGVQKRLETNLKKKRNNRLSVFDKIRNLSNCDSPAPATKNATAAQRRRQQLEKWKEEKEKKKKEITSLKKKPFVVGTVKAPLAYVPPPPPKNVPHTSGRVTRSQSARNNKQNETREKPHTKSFAPENATFCPPKIKNVDQLPVLGLAKGQKDKKSQMLTFAPKNATFCPPKIKKVDKLPVVGPVKGKKDKKQTFDPILPNKNDTKRQTRSKTLNKAEEKPTAMAVDKKTNIKVAKANKNTTLNSLKSSSSSEFETQTAANKSSPIMMDVDKKTNVKATKATKNTDLNSPKSSSSSEEQTVANKSSTNTPNKPKTPRKSRKSYPESSFTPKNPVPKSESSSEERLRSPKSPDMVDVPMTPEQITEEAKKISPCVTMSRGKDNARREMKKKLEEGLLDEDASDMDSVDHFRKQLASEIKRMTEMCETWERISEQISLPEAVQEAVLGAVGQARLLMSQRMAQFGALVERCARPAAQHPLVTPADLHGFWDMVFMQVENVDMRFRKLEEMRSRGWAEEVTEKVVKPTKKPVKITVKQTAGTSRIREMIAAARRAKKEQEQPAAPSPQLVVDNKTFEGGFFSVRSPVRSPALATPNSKPSLLKAVLSSEAKKASASKSASFAMLRASVLGKNAEYDGIAPLPQTPLPNLNATPARSILKQTSESVKKSNKKSIKVVLFDKSETDINSSIEKLNMNDSGPLMDIEEQKENSRRKSKLIRQDATEGSPIMTRSRRKSLIEKENTPRRSTRGKVLEEIQCNLEKETPKRSSRRRKSGVEATA